AGAALPCQAAFRIAAPDASCRIRRRLLEQLPGARCITVLSRSMARCDARDGKADSGRPPSRCCSIMDGRLKANDTENVTEIDDFEMVDAVGIESASECSFNNLQRSRWHVIPHFPYNAAGTARETARGN